MMIASFLLRNAFDYYDVVLLPSPPAVDIVATVRKWTGSSQFWTWSLLRQFSFVQLQRHEWVFSA